MSIIFTGAVKNNPPKTDLQNVLHAMNSSDWEFHVTGSCANVNVMDLRHFIDNHDIDFMVNDDSAKVARGHEPAPDDIMSNGILREFLGVLGFKPLRKVVRTGVPNPTSFLDRNLFDGSSYSVFGVNDVYRLKFADSLGDHWGDAEQGYNHHIDVQILDNDRRFSGDHAKMKSCIQNILLKAGLYEKNKFERTAIWREFYADLLTKFNP